MMMKKIYIAICCALFIAGVSKAQSNITTRVVKDSLFIPWEITWGPDNNIWLTQKNGYICRLHPATGMLDTLYHEPATVIQSEGGMLGMALHPQFAANPYIYVVYNYLQGTVYKERLVRYTYNGSNALSTPLILVDNINASVNHNGSRLLIVGDKLFFTAGDALNTSNAQNLSSPNGKIHRINLDGSIPSDNPIAGSSIWSWGHRNPQGMVYANGILYSSEHGNTTDDEINVIRKGRNFGWPTVEGYCDLFSEQNFCSDSNVAQPIKAWTPTLAVCGLDYYDAAMFPAWQGTLIMATLKDAHLYSLKLNAAKDSVISADVITEIAFGRLRDICISPAGRIYISTSNSMASGTGSKLDKIIELYDSAAVTAGIERNRSALTVNIYPNPAGDMLTGRYIAPTSAQYRIFSTDGRLMIKGIVSKGEISIPITKLSAGMYVVKLITESGDQGVASFIRN